MWVTKTIDETRERRGDLPGRVALVPTMGALHEGHLSLIKTANEIADHTLVSVFVNPTQFGPGEDFDRYPRPIEKDLELCKKLRVTGVFQPSVEEMYPWGTDAINACDMQVPAIASVLEGGVRPGHFQGVCRVVAQLFNILLPDDACFGQKDMQQLKIIEAMVDDLHFPINIIGCETVREKDGIALSSRNVYLDDTQRRQALGLYMALNEAKGQIEAGIAETPNEVEEAMLAILKAHRVEPDYAVLREATTLQPINDFNDVEQGLIALVAGRVGKVRLIDNLVLAEAHRRIATTLPDKPGTYDELNELLIEQRLATFDVASQQDNDKATDEQA